MGLETAINLKSAVIVSRESLIQATDIRIDDEEDFYEVKLSQRAAGTRMFTQT